MRLDALAALAALALASAGLRDEHDWRVGLVPGQALSDAEAVVVHCEPRVEGGAILPPGGLEARLVREGGDGRELAFPVGVFFGPPPGLYRFWIEGPGLISPFASRLPRVGGLPAGTALVGMAPTTRAGTVRLSGRLGDPEKTPRASLLALGASAEGDSTRFTLVRTVPLAERAQSIQMPVGDVVAVLWDPQRRDLVGVSRPVRIAAGASRELRFESPAADRAFVVVRARRGEPIARTADELDERVRLFLDGEELAPSASATGADAVYGFWYDAMPGAADLEVEWRGRFLDRALDLRGGGIVLVDDELRARPSLKVELALPAALRGEALVLEIATEEAHRRILSEKIRPGTDRRILSSVPATALAATLVTPFGRVTRSVDLSAGRDGSLRFEPELTTVSGTVRRGGEPHAATVRFTTLQGAQVVAETDETSRYEVVALEPLVAVRVELSEVRQAPWSDFFATPLAETTEMNFDLPATVHQVRVADRSNGRGIAGARVVLRNGYAPSSPEARLPAAERAGRTERAIAQVVVADADGVALLPPLRQGLLEVRASADGYETLQEPIRASIAEGDEPLSLEILLDRVEGGGRLVVRLPSGEPASGGEFQVLQSLAEGTPVAMGALDAEGSAPLPRRRNGEIVLVRHPAGAGAATIWQPTEDPEDFLVALKPVALAPLRLRLLQAGGREPAPRAQVAVATEAGFVTGGALRWLFEAEREEGGILRLERLPAGPARLVAWAPEREAEARAGALYGLALDLSWPWPASVEVSVVE